MGYKVKSFVAKPALNSRKWDEQVGVHLDEGATQGWKLAFVTQTSTALASAFCLFWETPD